MSGRAEIHLPFFPYLFLHIHYHKLYEEYDILYILEESLITNTNIDYLHSATKSDNHSILATHFQVVMIKQECFVKYSKKLSYMEIILMRRDDVEEQLILS